MKHLLYAFCLVMFLSCGNDDAPAAMEEETCPTEIAPTFSVTIRDLDGNALLDGVVITAMDQTFTAVLTEVSTGVYEGPDERDGSYTLRIEKDDYQTIITGQITPDEDECGLVTEVLSYQLEAL